jgi:phosphate transport system substrate-binding protein
MFRNLTLAAAAAACIATLSAPALANDDLNIIGSRTVAPYAKLVAAEFVKNRGFSEPEINESNTSQAFKHFCRGVGKLYPDLAMASRQIKEAEAKDCLANGVESYTQIKIGYDGVLLAYRADSGFGNLSLTGRQIWLAMAKNVPVNGAMALNPYKNWSDIDPSLPASPILLFLPEKGVAMRDVFGDLVLKGVCAAEPLMADLADEAREEACLAPREDGAILDFAVSRDALTSLMESADQPLTLTNIQLISSTPGAKDAKLVRLDGVAPDATTIAAGTYKASRSHYLYVKNQHVGMVPGVMEFVAEFLSDAAQGADGYLVKDGWMPLNDKERQEMLAMTKALVN